MDVRLGTCRPGLVADMVPAMPVARAEGPRVAVRSGCRSANRPRLAVRNAAIRPRPAQMGQTSSRFGVVALAKHALFVPPDVCGLVAEEVSAC